MGGGIAFGEVEAWELVDDAWDGDGSTYTRVRKHNNYSNLGRNLIHQLAFPCFARSQSDPRWRLQGYERQHSNVPETQLSLKLNV